MLSNAYFLAKFRFDTAENEPAKISTKFYKILQNSICQFCEGPGARARSPRLQRPKAHSAPWYKSPSLFLGAAREVRSSLNVLEILEAARDSCLMLLIVHCSSRASREDGTRGRKRRQLHWTRFACGLRPALNSLARNTLCTPSPCRICKHRNFRSVWQASFFSSVSDSIPEPSPWRNKLR